MIDIHTHILPGVDDGAADLYESLDLARAAVSEGIKVVIATPHHANELYYNQASEVVAKCQMLNEHLIEANIPLTVLTGQEIRVHDGLLDSWANGTLLSLANSRYALLEMPSASIPKGMLDLVYELSLLHVTPVIAHPERNAEVVKHPERLEELVDAGAAAQVTTHSLLGGFGKRIEQTAWQLCGDGLIHFVSSDAHHLQKRGFRLQEAYAAICQRMGAGWESYYKSNAERLADNLPLLDQPTTLVKKSGNRWAKFTSFFRPD